MRSTTGAGIALAMTMLAAAACSDDPETQNVPAVFELCTDGVDGDEDGLVDCDDPDCAAESACACGDGLCDAAAGEDTTCPLDCPMGCGDGVCNGPETPTLCPMDCPDPCGDGVCDPATEDAVNCLADCEGVSVCGNGVVEPDETCDGTMGLDACADLMPPRGQGTGPVCDAVTCTPDYSGCGLATCADTGTMTLGYSGTLNCADFSNGLEWDVFEFPVTAGDCIHIRTDNQGIGAADLRATAIDGDGMTFFGQAMDFAELDDEWACTNTPWAGAMYGCPERSIVAETTGTFRVGVTQWAGGCAMMPADFQIDIAVNGVDLDLTGGPVLDDTGAFP